mgnify:CR=1 FL=1
MVDKVRQGVVNNNVNKGITTNTSERTRAPNDCNLVRGILDDPLQHNCAFQAISIIVSQHLNLHISARTGTWQVARLYRKAPYRSHVLRCCAVNAIGYVEIEYVNLTKLGIRWAGRVVQSGEVDAEIGGAKLYLHIILYGWYCSLTVNNFLSKCEYGPTYCSNVY